MKLVIKEDAKTHKTKTIQQQQLLHLRVCTSTTITVVCSAAQNSSDKLPP